MGKRGEAAFLFAFSATAYAVLHSYAQSTLGSALRAESRLPPYFGADCLNIPPGSHYIFLPPLLDRLLCIYNRVFQLLQQSEPAALVASQFGRAYLIITAIIAYESFKQRTFWARRGLIFLLIGQAATGGGTIPLNFGLVAFSRRKHNPAPSVSTAEVWSVFIATLAGYCLPTYYVGKTGWSYDALSLWQIYPAYLSVLTIVLPSILNPFVRKTSPIVPIILIAVLAIAVSSVGHYQMLNSGVDFRDVARVFRQPDTLPSKVHKFFLMDFLFSVSATLTHIVFTFENATAEEWIGYALTGFFASMIFGAGGGIAVLWAFREILVIYNDRAKLQKVE